MVDHGSPIMPLVWTYCIDTCDKIPLNQVGRFQWKVLLGIARAQAWYAKAQLLCLGLQTGSYWSIICRDSHLCHMSATLHLPESPGTICYDIYSAHHSTYGMRQCHCNTPSGTICPNVYKHQKPHEYRLCTLKGQKVGPRNDLNEIAK